MKNFEEEPKKAVSKFANSRDRIFKAIGELETAISQVDNVFAPVLCSDYKNEATPKTDPALTSDFDIFIQNAEERIRYATVLLKSFCERSSI